MTKFDELSILTRDWTSVEDDRGNDLIATSIWQGYGQQQAFPNLFESRDHLPYSYRSDVSQVFSKWRNQNTS